MTSGDGVDVVTEVSTRARACGDTGAVEGDSRGLRGLLAALIVNLGPELVREFGAPGGRCGGYFSWHSVAPARATADRASTWRFNGAPTQGPLHGRRRGSPARRERDAGCPVKRCADAP